MRWPCQYVNSDGKRCSEQSKHRLHFGLGHPIDHVDTCDEHFKEYNSYKCIQMIYEDELTQWFYVEGGYPSE